MVKIIMILLISVLAVIAAILYTSCCKNETSGTSLEYSKAEMWYQSENQYDENKVDVIYFVSTDVLSAKDENGDVAWQSQLTKDDRASIDKEFKYRLRKVLSDDGPATRGRDGRDNPCR